jgi:hypothetical protein
MPVLQSIFDEVLDNALLVFRFAASERAATFERLRALEKELVGKLAAEAVTTRQKRRVETFIKEINEHIEWRYQQLQLEFAFEDFARAIATDMQYGLQVALGYDAIYLPKDHYFASLTTDVMIYGAPSADWWRGQSQDLAFRFGQQVRQGLSNSETNQQIINRIVGKDGQPGIMETARRNAATLVQTSVQAVANDARRNTFQANTDVISGIQQVSTLDSHTSITCISYSGEKWDLEYKPLGPKKLPYNNGCPRHMNCRSLEVPITKSFKELGLKLKDPAFTTRASDEGQIDADISFDKFLKRKGKAYQDGMLGKGRADLWRAKKITLKDLVDANGRPLTLAELQAAIAAKRR